MVVKNPFLWIQFKEIKTAVRLCWFLILYGSSVLFEGKLMCTHLHSDLQAFQSLVCYEFETVIIYIISFSWAIRMSWREIIAVSFEQQEWVGRLGFIKVGVKNTRSFLQTRIKNSAEFESTWTRPWFIRSHGTWTLLHRTRSSLRRLGWAAQELAESHVTWGSWPRTRPSPGTCYLDDIL